MRRVVALLALVLSACGGGGNDASAPVPSTPPPVAINPGPPAILADVIYGTDPSATRSVADIRLTLPEDSVQAADGSIYITDTHSHVIRKIKDGMVSVFAGTFLSGHNGDGPKGTTDLNLPTALLLTADGSGLIFADSGNYLLRKIDLASGQITTIAGLAGKNNLPVDGSVAKGNPIGWVSTLKVDAVGNIWFPSTNADSRMPDGGLFYISTDGKVHKKTVTVPGAFVGVRDIHIGDGYIDFTRESEYYRMYDKGNFVSVTLPTKEGKGIAAIADGLLISAHTAVLKLDNDMKLSTVASGFANVSNIKKVNSGYLITDSDQGVIYTFDGTNKTMLTGSSDFTDGALISVIKYGTSLLVLDNQKSMIWRVDPATGKALLWAGKGVQGWATVDVDKLQTTFYYPNSIAADNAGNVFVAEQHRVLKISPEGKVSRFAGYDKDGDIDSTDPTEARFRGIGGMATDAAGNLYIADTYNNKVKKVTPAGVVTTFAGTGSTNGTIYGIQATKSELNRPGGVLPLADGSVLIADSWNNAVHKVGADGVIRAFAGKVSFTGYQGNGTFSGDNGPAIDAGMNTPIGMTAAPDGSVYITDQFNQRIRKVSADGTIKTFAGSMQGYAPNGKLLNFPNGIVVIDKNLYVADSGNRIILRYKLD